LCRIHQEKYSLKKLARIHLIEERKRQNWSQKEVADFLGTTQHNVSRWESGLTMPGPYFRAKLCELFGKSPQELGLFGEQERDEQQPDPLPETPPLVQEQHLPLWHVPYTRNPHFTGRDDLLDQLAQHLSPEGSGASTTARRAALTQPHAIKGLGGIGKTQIAVEYAYRTREQGRYTHTFWVNAASEEAIMTSLVTLAELLPTFPAKDEKDQRKLVAAIKRWLEQCQQRWLLIFDNADDISLVQEYFPQQGNGSILLTTRANAVGALAVSIEVVQMGLLEGTQFLLHRTQRLHAGDEESNEATNVVIALDGFPLALDQAGAYIEETGCSFGDYLQLYQDHRKALLARRGTQVSHYPDSVATTWALSFQKVEHANPAAAELLRLCAFLAPDRIPEELLKDGAPHWPPLLQQAAADLFALNQMIKELLTFSLVKRLADDHLLSIHRLVQAVQVDTMEPEEQRQWAERVVYAVNTVFPRDPKNEVATWPQCLRYLEQAQVCDILIQQHMLLLPEVADLLDRTGIYLREHDSYTIAEPLFQRALHIREQQLGPEHPHVAISLNELAILYGQQGKYKEAEPLFQRALHIREQQLGPEHLQVATSLNSLAILYKDQGKYAEAEPLFQRAIAINERQSGPEHSQIAYPLQGLAELYRVQGKYREAEPLFQQALRIREQQLGPEHPLVAFPLNNLAILYAQQGKYAEAEPLFQQALRIREQQLGPEHPLIISPLNNLAELYHEQGKYREAEPLFQHVLEIEEHQLGTEHPHVAHSLTGLADLYREQGKYVEAEPLYQRALSIREQTLEPHHPYTAETLHSFAALREAQGNLQEAISLYRRALVIREHALGPQHPKASETRERIRAVLEEAQRDVEQATTE
jgi:tetratricopeptide (TPR) repeat protein/transcriptional regulator with XRE-family HTH domain